MSFHYSTTLNAEDLEQYRQYVAGLDVPSHEIDALINIVHAIICYFVDQAFNVQTDQITLESIENSSSKASFDHVRLGTHPENQIAPAKNIGVESDSNSIGPSEP